jgi:hypothetical protein
MLLYEVQNIIKIFYEKENELIIHEWFEYNPEDEDDTILVIFQNIYELFITYPVAKVLVKTNLTKGVFSPNMQLYIEEVQFPRLIADTNLRYIATIKAIDKMQAIGTMLWQNQFDKNADVILHNVANEQEAREWLQVIDQ